MTRTSRILVGVLIATLVFLFFITEVVHGASGINRELPFYGTLNDNKGKPLTGTHDMVFKIYNASTSGSVLWTGTHTNTNENAVSVTHGEFSVMLGSGTGNALTLDFNDDSYYLGITVGSDAEMTPRERLGASGYAINSDLLDGFHASAFVRSNQALTITASTSDALVAFNQTGFGKILTLSNGVDEFFTMLQSGNVGIGDADPAQKLAVEGTVSALTFMSTEDTLNSFAGPIEILSSDSSSFAGDVSVEGNLSIAEGSRVYFGSAGAGLSMYQDTALFDENSLMLMPYGEALPGSVNIMAPYGLALFANMNEGNSGPALIFSENGSAWMYSTSTTPGNPLDKILRIEFAGGVEVVTGDLQVLEGNVSIAGVSSSTPSLFVDGDGGLRVNNLADAIDISFDSGGNVIPNYSDERLKQNIHTIHNALDTVLNLRGVRYEWKDSDRFGEGTQIGFVAQELQQELPELVRDTGEYLSINAKNITAVLVEAIKELYGNVGEYMSRTERLEREVEALRSEVEMLKGRSEESTPVLEENNSGGEVIVVEENVVEEVAQPPAEAVGEETPSEPIPEV